MRGTPTRRRRDAGVLAMALGAAPLLAACAQEAPAGRAPAAPDPAGLWHLEGTRTGTLRLEQQGGEWEVAVVAGGDPADGPGVAADCEIHARGPLRDGRIEAPVVPFEGDTISVSAADLEAEPAQVRVEFDGDVARVSSDYRGCGLRGGVDGSYRRSGS